MYLLSHGRQVLADEGKRVHRRGRRGGGRAWEEGGGAVRTGIDGRHGRGWDKLRIADFTHFIHGGPSGRGYAFVDIAIRVTL